MKIVVCVMPFQMENRACFTIRPNSGNQSSEMSRKGTLVELTFVSAIPKSLMCTYCHQLSRRPCHVTCCSSPYCLDCVELLNLTTKKCAKVNCGKEFDIVTDDDIERRIKQVIVYCPRQENGCNWIGSIEDLEAVHWSSSPVGIKPDPNNMACQYQELECPNLCGLSLPRWVMQEHCLSQCGKGKVVCDEVLGVDESTPPTTATTTNQAVSSSSPVACPNHCGLPGILHHDIANHLEEECPFRIVACDYRHAGCDAELLLGDIPDHNSAFHQKHFDLVSEKLQLVTRENGVLRQRTEQLNRHVGDLLEMIRNLDRSDYEIHVRIVTSMDTRNSPSATADAVVLSSLASSLADVKDRSVINGGLFESGSFEASDGGCPAGEVSSYEHDSHLRSIGRDGSGGDSKHNSIMMKSKGRLGLDTGVPAVPGVSNTSLSGSTICCQPLSQNRPVSAIYEDIDKLEFLGGPPKEVPEKPSPVIVDRLVGQTERGRTKCTGYRRLMPLRFGALSSALGKGRFNSMSQLIIPNRSLGDHGKDTKVNEMMDVKSAESGNSVAQNGNDANLEGSIYETPIPIHKRNVSGPMKRRRHLKSETDSDTSGGVFPREPLPLAYAMPIQTRVRPSTFSSKEEVVLKPKPARPVVGFPSDNIEPPPGEEMKPQLPHKIPIFPATSKLIKVSSHSSKLGSNGTDLKVSSHSSKLGSNGTDLKDYSGNLESAVTSFTPVEPDQISSGHDSATEAVNVLTPPPRSPTPYMEPQSVTAPKLPTKARLKPPTKYSNPTKTVDVTDSAVSNHPTDKKTPGDSELTPLNTNSKPVKIRPRRGSKSLKVESNLPQPISRYAAASGSKGGPSSRTSRHSQ